MADQPSLETMRSRIYDPVLYPSLPNLIGDLRSDAMRLLDEVDGLRYAAVHVRATLRGMLSDENVTRSIDLSPEIDILTKALGDG